MPDDVKDAGPEPEEGAAALASESGPNYRDEAAMAALLQKRSEGEMLSLAEITRELGVSYGRLRVLAEAAGVAKFMGVPENVKGGRGAARYPADALYTFASLLRAQDEKLVTPQTAGAWLAKLETQPLVDLQQSNKGGS